MEHKTDFNITKIDKYKKNGTALLYRSTKQTWAKLKLKNNKTEHDGAQSRHEHNWKTE